MVRPNEIQQFSQRIADRFHPERIILFGSYSEGRATEDSDVDLLVILAGVKDPVKAAVDIRLFAKPPFPLDLVVRTPEAVSERVKLGDPFMRGILEHGEVLYEAGHP